MYQDYKCYQGATLIELVVAIVVVAISLTGIMTVMIYATMKSVDPAIEQQAIAIGEAYLEEILTKDYPTVFPCPAPSGTRSTFTNICDYDSIGDPTPVAVEDQFGTPITALSDYQVQVNITFNTLLTLGNDAARINVIVYHNAFGSLLFTGYRTNY